MAPQAPCGLKPRGGRTLKRPKELYGHMLPRLKPWPATRRDCGPSPSTRMWVRTRAQARGGMALPKGAPVRGDWRPPAAETPPSPRCGGSDGPGPFTTGLRRVATPKRPPGSRAALTPAAVGLAPPFGSGTPGKTLELRMLLPESRPVPVGKAVGELPRRPTPPLLPASTGPLPVGRRLSSYVPSPRDPRRSRQSRSFGRSCPPSSGDSPMPTRSGRTYDQDHDRGHSSPELPEHARIPSKCGADDRASDEREQGPEDQENCQAGRGAVHAESNRRHVF